MDLPHHVACRRSIALTVMACCALLSTTARGGEDLAQEARGLRGRYAIELGRLAGWCRQKDLAGEAHKTLDAGGRQDPYKILVPVLPQEVGSLRGEAKTPDRVEWRRRLTKLRQDQAAALFGLAQRAVRRHQPALAYGLTLEALAANPDHEGARRVFGYQKYQNQWHTPFEIRMLRAGMVWSEKFGWINRLHLARYERGERLLGSTWIDAAADATLHAEMRNGWDIETEHYRIRTNHGIEAAVALGSKLENLHRLWRQMFIGYYAGEADVEALFTGKPQAPLADTPRLEVVYFRNQAEYHQALRPTIPDIGISMGLYVAENRTAYFYAGSEDTERTTYHEATHQLFQQSRRVADDVGRKANFWLVEGIAMYMETLRRQDGYFVLGGLDDVRMEAARYHLQQNDFYVPLEKVVRMGMQDVQSHPRIASLYSQIAAMTHFLIHYDDGRYRDALVSCLAAVYNGNQDPDLLARETGTSYAELDKQYQAYAKTAPPEKRSNSE